jgi:ketosteroid isomerase-like protein
MIRPQQVQQGVAVSKSIRTALILSLVLAPALATAADCDRACLAGMVTKYVDAIVAHKPAQLPLTAGVRYTEAGRETVLGEGLWKTVTGKGDFRQDYLDVHRQIAAAHFTLREGENQILYSVVMHLQDQKITGIESLAQRMTPNSRFQPTELAKPLPHFNDPVPADKRNTREEMIRIALTYPEGLRIGNFTNAPTPFAKEAYRIENGMYTAGFGCARCAGMYEQKIMVHPDLKASTVAVDEDNGAVLLWMNFGDTNSYGAGNALVTYEAFKIWGGEIQAITAFFPTLPVTTERGWPTLEANDIPAPGYIDARLRRMEDEAAIERLLVEYGRALDARDFAAYAALFTTDGTFDGALGAYTGQKQIQTEMEKIFNDAAADIPKGQNFHVMSNFIIDVAGNRATASSRFVFYKLDGGKPVAEVAGTYEDQLVRIGGVWKFQLRKAR